MKQIRKCTHSAAIYGMLAPLQILCSGYFEIIHIPRTSLCWEFAINLKFLHGMNKRRKMPEQRR